LFATTLEIQRITTLEIQRINSNNFRAKTNVTVYALLYLIFDIFSHFKMEFRLKMKAVSMQLKKFRI